MPTEDPFPALVGDSIFVGNKHHAASMDTILSLGITAVLNCAPSGIRNLPLNSYREHGIHYEFTNVVRDDESYPILHDKQGVGSEHVEVAKSLYGRVCRRSFLRVACYVLAQGTETEHLRYASWVGSRICGRVRGWYRAHELSHAHVCMS